jgi:hypothetical protein
MQAVNPQDNALFLFGRKLASAWLLSSFLRKQGRAVSSRLHPSLIAFPDILAIHMTCWTESLHSHKQRASTDFHILAFPENGYPFADYRLGS